MNTIDPKGTYGTPLVESASNLPGARTQAFYAYNPNNNCIYIFGGYGRDSAGTLNLLSDMWRYNITSQNFAYLSGSTLVNDGGTVGGMGIFSSNFTPAARRSYGSNMVYLASSNSLYMFGGTTSNSVSACIYNEFWQFSLSLNQWAFINGTVGCTISSSGYGTKLVEDPSNSPTFRYGTFMFAIGSQIYMYGGRGGRKLLLVAVKT